MKRYTTSTPKTAAGAELYILARDLLHLESHAETERWFHRFLDWMDRYHEFLSQMTRDENGQLRPTHERILKAQGSLLRLLKDGAMLRDHRGLNVERRIKAVFWWCYTHSPEPLSANELLKAMPTDKSIADIYNRLSDKRKLDDSIPTWGDAIVWNELHRSTEYPELWS